MLLPVLQAQDDWSNEALYETLVAVAAERGVKNSIILWPLRVAVSGKASTPGGATEPCALGSEKRNRAASQIIFILRMQSRHCLFAQKIRFFRNPENTVGKLRPRSPV